MFDKGYVAEKGRYEELVAKKGYFYNLERGTDFLWFYFYFIFLYSSVWKKYYTDIFIFDSLVFFKANFRYFSYC